MSLQGHSEVLSPNTLAYWNLSLRKLVNYGFPLLFFLFTFMGWCSFLHIHPYYLILYPSFFIVRVNSKSKKGLCCPMALILLQIPPLFPHDMPTITLLYIRSYGSCFSDDLYTLCDMLIPNMSCTMVCGKGSQRGLVKLVPIQYLPVQIDSIILANHQGYLSRTHVKGRTELDLRLIVAGVDIC